MVQEIPQTKELTLATLIHNATVINDGATYTASVVVQDDTIAHIIPGETTVEEALVASSGVLSPGSEQAIIVEATGRYLIPGAIDEHVHFREPGMTHKATIASESRKAVRGGVTSFMDMPNCIPPTTTLSLVEAKHRIAEACSPANWSFHLGATKDNLPEILQLDPATNCGVKVFMGSSTGGMLLNDDEALRTLFAHCPLPIALHCEDQDIIAANAAHYRKLYGEDPDVRFHPLIRSEEACYRSSARAVELATQTGADIHILHISTARELSLFDKGPVTGKRITAEACVPHLLYTDADYATLGTAVKCNPAIKTADDRQQLRQAIHEGLIDTVGTDHAPHTPQDKAGGALHAASGMTTLPHSLTQMFRMADEGAFSRTDVVRVMCHNPALRYHISRRGFIHPGYKADLVLLANDNGWRVDSTWVNGQLAFDGASVNEAIRGERLLFDR